MTAARDLLAAVFSVAQGGGDEGHEQRVRAVRAGLELGVVLHADEEALRAYLHGLDEPEMCIRVRAYSSAWKQKLVRISTLDELRSIARDIALGRPPLDDII